LFFCFFDFGFVVVVVDGGSGGGGGGGVDDGDGCESVAAPGNFSRVFSVHYKT
jgi:hypothetical protein